jgi:peptidoglycan/LPS O-acetylase OafA/YrhL
MATCNYLKISRKNRKIWHPDSFDTTGVKVCCIFFCGNGKSNYELNIELNTFDQIKKVMIQRVQSIWLLLVGVCAFATYGLPIYAGHLPDNTEKKFFIPDNFLLFLLVCGLGALALVSIFLFKKRKLQFRLTIFGILLSLLLIFLEYTITANFKQDNKIQSGSYYLGAMLPVAMVIFFILAARGINKDDKLVKSMDKLR